MGVSRCPARLSTDSAGTGSPSLYPERDRLSPRASGSLAGGGDDDGAFGAMLAAGTGAAHDGLHRGRLRPVAARDAEVPDPGVRDQAVTDVDDLVRAVGAQPGHAVVADGELHAGAPPKPRVPPLAVITSLATGWLPVAVARRRAAVRR